MAAPLRIRLSAEEGRLWANPVIPRDAVARQVAAVLAAEASPDLNTLNRLTRGGQDDAAADTAGNDNETTDQATAAAPPRRRPAAAGGWRRELTPLVYAVRSNDVRSVEVLLDAGADVNQVTGYGWSPLLVATQNRYYRLGTFLMDNGADPNLAHNGGWTPLYLATDNRNIENGDYPVRKGDMDQFGFHPAPSRQRRKRKCPNERQHGNPNRFYEPVAG